MKKLLAVLLAAVLAASCCLPAFAAEERHLRYLLLGDSIAEGYGVENPDEACYGRIVADTDGYDYENYARVAMDSGELLERLSEETGYFYIRSAVARADIISLSIGGNDYFDHPDVVNLAVGAFFMVNGKKLDGIAEQFYENLCAVIGEIKALNPDATILLQKLYCVWYGVAAHIYTACTGRVNAMIEKYDKEHPGAVVLCDISPAMDGHPERLADDCVHPNAAGNAAIAEVVLRQLYDLGLGTETTPVVNHPGVDYNFFEKYYDNKTVARLLTVLIKTLTGNLVPRAAA
ncbi:MAG: SGNH/GDSL hydrolase family protein [Clostridia bacterium]|nr:SGNH/GDSL hydrolase family protein [Clostridia bacterium]